MEKYYLGIDYGDSKIGLALADSETRMAFGHSIVFNDEKVLENLKEVFGEYEIESVVIGIPEYLTYENKNKIEVFVDWLEKEFDVSVKMQGEMFTTKLAQAQLKQAEKKNLGKIDDQEAARIILQDWLDNN